MEMRIILQSWPFEYPEVQRSPGENQGRELWKSAFRSLITYFIWKALSYEEEWAAVQNLKIDRCPYRGGMFFNVFPSPHQYPLLFSRAQLYSPAAHPVVNSVKPLDTCGRVLFPSDLDVMYS